MSKPLYIVAVDGSEWSNRAAARAISLAEETNANIKLITVMDWSFIHPIAMEGSRPPTIDKDAEEQATIERILVPLAEQYKERDINITYELLWGDPVIAILDHLKLMHANMIFVGRQGRSRIVDLLVGSVANKLAHRVGIPIVLVP
ncbi:universal stress protein [Thalassotalea sp. PLHSN55]|uniref:universal stress protein n=1 Tax=Thalassotalea sp. PLHSN55 TaxID=3435888 RepID=UPI003F8575E3